VRAAAAEVGEAPVVHAGVLLANSVRTQSNFVLLTLFPLLSMWVVIFVTIHALGVGVGGWEISNFFMFTVVIKRFNEGVVMKVYTATPLEKHF
tara:strand:+ start:1575 stop:1853 length:279 start_codon:yes stop_codon:yes gene_type:complete